MRNEYTKSVSGSMNETPSNYKVPDNIKIEDSDYDMEVNDDLDQSKPHYEELMRLEELREEEDALQKRKHELRSRVEQMEGRIMRFKGKIGETVSSMNAMAVKMGINVESK